MTLNLSNTTLSQSANLKLHILIEHSSEEMMIASVLELPNCFVEAPNQEQALEDIKKLLHSRLGYTKRSTL
ncbi:hypothetical protein [Brasilonema sp. UFV-L1]|uniref:type II toxin-antitoxin system HicB family antitoxin n=1 Tax=Brasilonema sp. UFV-L1 TaxID=2234130 RepID=UPI00145D4895|nr:hypothetical protein [Brasilonema sp. UFV-L1]